MRLFKIELSWPNLLSGKIHILVSSVLKSLANNDNVIIYLLSEDFFFLETLSFIVMKIILRNAFSAVTILRLSLFLTVSLLILERTLVSKYFGMYLRTGGKEGERHGHRTRH